MKKLYVSPEADLLKLASEDILTLSVTSNTLGFDDCGNLEDLF